MLPLFTIRNLSTGYAARQVLFDVCLELRASEIVVVIGGNGSGKSTLLKAVFGLLKPWNGNAEIIYRPNPDGELGPTIDPVRNLRNGIALLPQTNAVFDNLSVDNNLHISGYTFRSRRQFIARREEVLDRISAIRPLLRRNTSQLSGGELRLVSLAMVLIHRPRLLLLDEPLSGLDSQNVARVLEIIREAQSAYAITILMTEHRHLETASLGGRTCKMRQGRLEHECADGSLSKPIQRRIP